MEINKQSRSYEERIETLENYLFIMAYYSVQGLDLLIAAFLQLIYSD